MSRHQCNGATRRLTKAERRRRAATRSNPKGKRIVSVREPQGDSTAGEGDQAGRAGGNPS
jgi:hypothetical protein